MKINGLSGLLILTCLTLSTFSVNAQLWEEDFESGTETTSGNATGSIGGPWTTTLPTGGAASFTRANTPYGGIFFVNNTGTEGVWRSNVLNISTMGDVAIEITVGGLDATAADYVRAYYIVDGGAEVMFGQAIGSPGLTIFTAASAVVSGSTLQIVVRARDNSPGGANAMGFDNVLVTDIGILYSIANNNWNNGNTWSSTGFGGLACGCTPDADTRVIIGNGRTVSFNVDGSAAGVEIQNTGRLQWSADNMDLTVAKGGILDVQNGGVLTRNGRLNSSIIFGNYTYASTIAGTVDIGLISYTASSNSTLTNSGALNLATANGLVFTGGNGYVITNSGTITLTNMDLNTVDITVDNSGTIDQLGNFTDVGAGSAFNNLSGGTWNFGGTVITNVRLFADNNSNTFNYNRAGNQNIITPQDAYSNLTLSTSGTKTALANFSVRGNWTKSGTATFAPGAFRVTLNGTQAQTISAAGGETFANLTINNSFATAPQITLNNNVTVSTNLTMTDGNVNLNGNTLTISGSLNHSLASTAGWMYGGSITRAFSTANVTVGTAAGLFPLGDASDFRPFFMGKTNPTANSNGTMTVTYTPATTATNVSFTDNTIPASASTVTIQRRHDAYWTVAKTGMTGGTYQLSAGGTGFTIGAASDLRLTRASDATNIGQATASSITGGDVRVNRTGVPIASLVNSFFIATLDGTNSPLPIELAFYRAAVAGDAVISTWKTLQEKNNHFFTVQKTTDFEHFYDVGRIDGKGNSTDENTYTFIDNAPFTGKSYYRLKQTDFDGLFTYSKPVMVDYDGSSLALKAYPNPFSGREITVELMGIRSPGMTLNIYNQHGQKVIEVTMDQQGPGVLRKLVTFPEDLPPGLYYLKAGRSQQLTGKVVVAP